MIMGSIGKRMMLIDQLRQAFFQNMGVNLGGRYVGMAKQFLHEHQIPVRPPDGVRY